MSEVQIDAPRELTVPPFMGGVSDNTYQQSQYWVSRGFFWSDQPNDRSEMKIDRVPYVPLASVDLWCSLGSELLKYQIWHQLADPELICPYSENQDENWHQWGLSSVGGHAPIEISGLWYRSNLYGDLGITLPATDWYGFIGTPDPGVTGIAQILTIEEFQAIPRPIP